MFPLGLMRQTNRPIRLCHHMMKLKVRCCVHFIIFINLFVLRVMDL